jgi:nucleoside-diphosphate-sugar epimerase
MRDRTTPPRTAVIAGCGDLGTRAGLRLAAAGYRVVGLRRDPNRLPPPIEGRQVDLSRRVPRLPPDTTVVIGALTADAHTARAYRDTYLGGLTRLLDAVDTQLEVPPRMLWVSSTAVYGVTDGGWVDEHTPAVPDTETGSVLFRAERLLHARHPTATVLRLVGLYGTVPNTLVSAVAKGSARIPREPLYANRVHRDDAAEAIVHLATRVPCPAPLYLGADDLPVDRGTLLRFIADRLGVPHPPPQEGPHPRGRGKRCRNHRIRGTGLTLAYPTYREGYGELLEEHRPGGQGAATSSASNSTQTRFPPW